MLRLEKRVKPSTLWQLLAMLLALAAAAAVTALMLQAAGTEPGPAFIALYEGAFGDAEAWAETLVKATPLLLTGLAFAIALRARVWNIGAEGQLLAGAMAAYWASAWFGHWPAIPLLIISLLASISGGAALGGLAALLKNRFAVNEVLSTVMLNYVVYYLLSYLLIGPWMQPGTFYAQTAPLPEAAQLPSIISDSRLHPGFLLALLGALLIGILLRFTPLGYEIRAFGFNPLATRFKGTKASKPVAVVMLLGGGLAGLAGGSELLGVHERLSMEIATGVGYTGIIVAMLGGAHPLGIVLAAVLFGGLANGAFMMQIMTGVPMALVEAMQAIVLVFFLCASVLSRYRIQIQRRSQPV